MSYVVRFTDYGDKKIELYFGKEVVYTADVEQFRVITEVRSGYDATFKNIYLLLAKEIDFVKDARNLPTGGTTLYKSLDEFLEVALMKHQYTLRNRNLVVLDPSVRYKLIDTNGLYVETTREVIVERLEQLEVLKAAVKRA